MMMNGADAESADDDDLVECALQLLGAKVAPGDIDPRDLVPHAHAFPNKELEELLLRLSAENERIGRVLQKSKRAVKAANRSVRDREVEVRRDPKIQQKAGSGARLNDLLWEDLDYRVRRKSADVWESAAEAIQADLDALTRHHAAVSRTVELRRQEQERDLIDMKVPLIGTKGC